TVEATGQLNDAAQFRPLIVSYRNGSPIRLDAVGNVFDSVENTKTASWFATRQHTMSRAVTLAIYRQPGTNTVDVVEPIRQLIAQFEGQMPASVRLEVLSDRSLTIRDSVHDVKFTLVLALALVVMVIFLFLRNFSATLIPSLALPMSIVGTF